MLRWTYTSSFPLLPSEIFLTLVGPQSIMSSLSLPRFQASEIRAYFETENGKCQSKRELNSLLDIWMLWNKREEEVAGNLWWVWCFYDIFSTGTENATKKRSPDPRFPLFRSLPTPSLSFGFQPIKMIDKHKRTKYCRWCRHKGWDKLSGSLWDTTPITLLLYNDMITL